MTTTTDWDLYTSILEKSYTLFGTGIDRLAIDRLGRWDGAWSCRLTRYGEYAYELADVMPQVSEADLESLARLVAAYANHPDHEPGRVNRDPAFPSCLTLYIGC